MRWEERSVLVRHARSIAHPALAGALGVIAGVTIVLLVAPGRDGRVLWLLLRDGAVPIVWTVLMVLGFARVGWLMLDLAGPRAAGSDCATYHFLIESVVGAAAVSTLVVCITALELAEPFGYTGLRVGLLAAGALGLIRRCAARPPAGAAEPRRSTIVYAWTLFLVAVSVLVVASLVLAPTIHPDAMQYHLAIPRSFALADGFVDNDTLLHNSTYLGFDVLYPVVADLRVGPSRLVGTFPSLNTFSFAAALSIVPSTYSLARTLGATSAFSMVSAGSILTVSSIARAGTLKNDVVAASVAIVALTALVRAARQPTRREVVAAGVAIGFSVAIKIPMAVVFALPSAVLVVLVLRGRRQLLRPMSTAALAAAAVVLPWIIRATVQTGNPLHPLFSRQSADRAAGWAARNANGLDLTPTEFVRRLPALLLDQYEVSGNDSMGTWFVIAFVVASLVFVVQGTRRSTPATCLVFASGALFLALFSVTVFEGRFLTRYLVVSAATTFAALGALASTQLRRLEQVKNRPASRHREVWCSGAALVAIIPLAWSAGLLSAARTRLTSQPLTAYASGTINIAQLRKARDDSYGVDLYMHVNDMTGTGSTMINDHMFLFLDRAPVNVHALHSDEFSWDELDAQKFQREMQIRDIRTVVLRPGISGTKEVVLEYVERCGIPDFPIGSSVEVFLIREECR